MLLYFQSKGIDEALSFNVAESVRKGKGIKPELCEKLLANGVPDWYIESCQKIKYLFPKAHATAYMTASFVCC
jgi:DNA polymerase-3 subunit alpha (Gram-positive type)